MKIISKILPISEKTITHLSDTMTINNKIYVYQTYVIVLERKNNNMVTDSVPWKQNGDTYYKTCTTIVGVHNIMLLLRRLEKFGERNKAPPLRTTHHTDTNVCHILIYSFV